MGTQRPIWSAETSRLMAQMPSRGIFLTGIEGSDPWVAGSRRDLFREAGDFYTTYRERLENIRSLGINWLRLGPPYSQVHVGVGTYQLEWFDQVMECCRKLGFKVILDLMHFGLPDWQHHGRGEGKYFQNPGFPEHFAEYVTELARRYPEVTWFTPVNEPFVTASFSSLTGIWNEGSKTPEAYVRAALHIARAAILAKQAIREVWKQEDRPGEPYFVQNDSFEEAILPPDSTRVDEVELFNRCYRFAPLDLILGQADPEMERYLASRGLTADEYGWCMEHGDHRQTILGIDHYATCVHEFHDHGIHHRSYAQPYALYRITKEYWERYSLPLLHTEVNAWPDDAVRVCQETYQALARLRREGYPVIGMGWYGDESQADWQTALTSISGEETPVGLFRAGNAQAVGRHFSALAQTGFPSIKFS